MIELKVPSVGESISEAMVGEWLKAEGDSVDKDETVVVIETDKVNVEVPAPESGTLKKILKQDGDDCEIGEVIGHIEAAEATDGDETSEKDTSDDQPDEQKSKQGSDDEDDERDETAERTDKKGGKKKDREQDGARSDAEDDGDGDKRVMPAARRALSEAGLDASEVEASGPGGRLLKEDVRRHLERSSDKPSEESSEKSGSKGESSRDRASKASDGGSREEERVKMSPLRRRVAQRLVESQQNAALLTTFNEIDMSAVIALRKQYQEDFVEKYDVKLGFMSFFVKATIEALKAVPQVNARVDGDHVVYRNYQDIGIAVGGGKGLVVPIIRNAERLSFAEIETTIGDFARRARDNKLTLDELTGGTFTISNGGIYGSLLSTPIVNPPQSGILGLHKIEDRPVAKDGEVVIRPMMYVALTYDHRIIDGREAVTFLVKIKERIEDPSRILLEV